MTTAGGEPGGGAVVGCGNISNAYLSNLTSFPDVRVLFCADLDLERAQAQAAKYGVPAAGSTARAPVHPRVGTGVHLTLSRASAAPPTPSWAPGCKRHGGSSKREPSACRKPRWR